MPRKLFSSKLEPHRAEITRRWLAGESASAIARAHSTTSTNLSRIAITTWGLPPRQARSAASSYRYSLNKKPKAAAEAPRRKLCSKCHKPAMLPRYRFICNDCHSGNAQYAPLAEGSTG